MMSQIQNSTRKKYAVGHYLTREKYDTRTPFGDLIDLYGERLLEVYFPWPKLNNARGFMYESESETERLIFDLKKCRKYGMKLDLLVNATCYHEESFTTEQRQALIDMIAQMDTLGVRPEIVTTTSPFVAKIFKMFMPDIEVRASVNMRLRNTLALEYLEDIYDSYYICRDVQRDIPTILMFEKWCKEHGKKLCLLANSGCIRNCPFQVFHETLLAHNYDEAVKEMSTQKMGLICNRQFRNEKFTEILRASWIRPEDIHLWEPHVSVIKLSTREAERPECIMKAYVEEKWDDNLLYLLDPSFSFYFRPLMIDNRKFPKDWAVSGIGGKCADNCTNCGKCDAVLEQVLVNDVDRLFQKDKNGKHAQFTFQTFPFSAPNSSK